MATVLAEHLDVMHAAKFMNLDSIICCYSKDWILFSLQIVPDFILWYISCGITNREQGIEKHFKCNVP